MRFTVPKYLPSTVDIERRPIGILSAVLSLIVVQAATVRLGNRSLYHPGAEASSRSTAPGPKR